MKVKSVYMIQLPSVGDERGVLTSIEENITIPFEIKRIFYMHHVNQDRGGHAHKDTDQVIIPISGTLKVKVFDGITEEIFLLDNCTQGLYTPRLTYCDLYDFSADAVCLVLANTHYDMAQSLRSIGEFTKYIKNS